eukprot:GFUD01026448.1.p1 GENE.GFUD01026448.1~~GFUD01026448.1.p1  ORF type:complete len:227 (-),score=60.11 GFUD01026448.1:273-953(-)
MSNYDANPVGFLYERYQSSGVSPLYEVVMERGQAHAPIFKAILTVPEGHKVTATGSSKKIAKNTAAKMMLDKLDGREGKENIVCVEIKDETNTGPADSNNNVDGCPVRQIQTLADQPSAAASVADFYQGLQKSSGLLLDKLHNDEICLAIESMDCVDILEQLADEQQFRLQFLQVESLEGLDQSLVQIFSSGDRAVTVCLGQGEGSKNSAARCALMYIKTMSKPAS